MFRMKIVIRKTTHQFVNCVILPETVTHVHFTHDIQANTGRGDI